MAVVQRRHAIQIGGSRASQLAVLRIQTLNQRRTRRIIVAEDVLLQRTRCQHSTNHSSVVLFVPTRHVHLLLRQLILLIVLLHLVFAQTAVHVRVACTAHNRIRQHLLGVADSRQDLFQVEHLRVAVRRQLGHVLRQQRVQDGQLFALVNVARPVEDRSLLDSHSIRGSARNRVQKVLHPRRLLFQKIYRVADGKFKMHKATIQQYSSHHSRTP